jgi:translation initiation factor IF-3
LRPLVTREGDNKNLHDADPNLVHNVNHIPDRIRLVDIDKTWIATKQEVLMRIRETDLDLYQMDMETQPPVYKLLDYGRYRFDKQKKEREQKKKQREMARPVKEFKFKPGCGDHDISVKIHHIRENLPEHDVKICMDLKRTAFVLTNRWSRSIKEAVSDEDFVLNKILVELQDVVHPVNLNITDNQVYAVLKYNGETISDQ